MNYATLDRRDLCDLARFRILDARNCNEAAKDRLLLALADEIDRLRRFEGEAKRLKDQLAAHRSLEVLESR